MIAVIVIRFLFVNRVVPSMQLRSADQIIQPAQPHIHVGMLKESVHGIPDNIRAQHVFLNAEHDERQCVTHKLQTLIHRMKPSDVQRVERCEA